MNVDPDTPLTDDEFVAMWKRSTHLRTDVSPVYHPHQNAFWYGTVCGFCLATSIAAFAAATHYLGVW